MSRHASTTLAVLACLLLVQLAVPVHSSPVSEVHHESIIVGAGPGGVQLAQFMADAGRDFIVLEAGAEVGGAFLKLPRFRTLISVNKVFTGHEGPDAADFNLRHDWNSLLTMHNQEPAEEPLLFSEFSKEYYPSADDLVAYLQAFVEKNGISIRFNSRVQRVQRWRGSGFKLTAADGQLFTCDRLYWAAGIPQPTMIDIPGIEHAVEYTQLNTSNLAEFENKRVLILGRGNAAFEVAEHIQDKTAYVHLLGSTRHQLRLAWETHYVGDVRAIHNRLLDSYMLKSLDAMLEIDIKDMQITRDAAGLHVSFQDEGVTCAGSNPFRAPYDAIISCLGFAFDGSPFDEEVRPKMLRAAGHNKFPAQSPGFESVNVRNLFFAGALMHANDYRKSAGGFLHGFRYLIRAMHRLAEQRNHEQVWPHSALYSSDEVIKRLLFRINTASGPYQMFGQLSDVLVCAPAQRGSEGEPDPEKSLPCMYFEEVPSSMAEELAHEWLAMWGVEGTPQYFTFTFEYGEGHSSPGRNAFELDRATVDVAHADKSRFLHPVLRYCASVSGKPTKMLHILEDFLTDWSLPEQHIQPLTTFIHSTIGKTRSVKDMIDATLKFMMEQPGSKLVTGKGARGWDELEEVEGGGRATVAEVVLSLGTRLQVMHFHADWDPRSRAMHRDLREVAEEFDGEIVIAEQPIARRDASAESEWKGTRAHIVREGVMIGEFAGGSAADLRGALQQLASATPPPEPTPLKPSHRQPPAQAAAPGEAERVKVKEERSTQRRAEPVADEGDDSLSEEDLFADEYYDEVGAGGEADEEWEL